MHIFVVGSGGREHALCCSLAASPLISKLTCAPGNAGIAEVADCIDVTVEDLDRLVSFSKNNAVDFVVVGPEAPLVAGLADALEDAGIPVFGPSAQAAQLEASKSFTKGICSQAEVPTARAKSYTDADAAKAYARELGTPLVVKADGLASGKGVRICETTAAAYLAIDSMLKGEFGAASRRIVVEEHLSGEEVSVFALVHGPQVRWLASAQDHKRAGDGDTGPNTGGMGAYSPAPVMTPELQSTVTEKILLPTARQMVDNGTPYSGVLFAGLMVTGNKCNLLEYNVRFGDPECQVILARLQSDLLPLLIATRSGTLDSIPINWASETALTVVLAAKGYPGTYVKESEINGLESAKAMKDVMVFHAGTHRDGGKVRATGGRTLSVTALGQNVTEAQRRAYAAVDAIDWPEGFCRRDIGWKALARSS